MTESLLLIERAISSAKAPVVMWSGGKDSMVLLHLIRMLGLSLPVIFLRETDHPEKYAFADQVIRDWGLNVHTLPPQLRGVWQRGEAVELVNLYAFGPSRLALPRNLYEGDRPECGLECLEKPVGRAQYPWDLVLHGHKNCDVDPLLGAVPLKSSWVKQPPAPDLVFPLRDWTDEDIWAYTRRHEVPQQATRYQVDGRELPDKALNPDWANVCTRCMNLRAEQRVMCPRLGRLVANVSAEVPRVPIPQLDYIG